MNKRMIFVSALVLAAAGAAAVPAAADSDSLPSYAQPGDASIHGVVRSVDGPYTISVRDEKGYVDRVTLHDGTIINPRGLKLAPGQTVTILGQPSGNTFNANEIDTPYQRYGFAYPYGPYPYPPYGYYPRFGVAVGAPGFRFRGVF